MLTARMRKTAFTITGTTIIATLCYRYRFDHGARQADSHCRGVLGAGAVCQGARVLGRFHFSELRQGGISHVRVKCSKSVLTYQVSLLGFLVLGIRVLTYQVSFWGPGKFYRQMMLQFSVLVCAIATVMIVII